MWYDDSAHPALVALLEFEEQRLGTPVELRVGHLLDSDRSSPMRPVVEVLVHTEPSTMRFPIPLGDKVIDVEAPAYYLNGLHDIGPRRGEQLYPLAGVDGNRLCVYFDLNCPFRVGSPLRGRTQNLGNLVAGFIFNHALDLVVRNIRRHDWDAEAKAYAQSKMSGQLQMVREWQRDIAANDRSIEDKTWEIEALARKNGELRDHIKTFEQLTRKRRERRAVEEHRNLLRMVGRSIRRLSFADRKLRVLTDSIEVRYDGHDYKFGCMWMDISMHGSRIVITPENSSHTVEGFAHPHINSDGIPCLGNIGSTVAQLIGEGKLYDAVSFLLEFLRSYNPENPYLRIEKWDPDWQDDEDKWENCYDESSLSDCATCDDHNCTHRGGAEERCYNNTNTENCIECASCSQHEDAIQDCRGEHSPLECMDCTNDCRFAGEGNYCHEAHAGELCEDCPRDDCEHYPQEEGDENDEEHPAHPAAGG